MVSHQRGLRVYRWHEGLLDFLCAARSRDAIARLRDTTRALLQGRYGIHETQISEERAIALSAPGHVWTRNGNGWSPWRG
jgi:hypothetical protein